MEVVINGNPVTVPEELQDVTLLDFLRDFTGLRGTKFGCGMGLCGACTIHLDAVAARSCQVTMADVADRRVTTIEGLAATAPSRDLHPVQQAWIAGSVPQCGYCQAGQIMTAAALLQRNPNPSDTEIREEMNGNLCRCGTYTRIRKAIAQAAREVNNGNAS